MYPHERSLVEEHKDNPFALIGVNSDTDKTVLGKRLVAENITWRSFWCGPKGTQGPIPTRWNVSGWPTVYILDPEGVIKYKGHGGGMDRILEEEISRAVASSD